MAEKTEWFAESAVPITTHVAWYRDDDGKPSTFHTATVLVTERLYPTDAHGWREPGSDWTDSRVRMLDTDVFGTVDPTDPASNFIGFHPLGAAPDEETSK